MPEGKVKWNVSMPEAIEAVAVLQEIDPKLKILDVGGAMKPFVFSTHVIDLIGYEGRGAYGYIPDEAGRGAERYTVDSWLVHDICELPWPYEDNEFDFVWCTQTIEDARDPIGIIREMCRVGKVGYITTIHRNFESLFDVNAPDFAGYIHHRWLIQQDGDRMRFIFKFPLIHVREEYRPVPTGERELSVWWTGYLEAYEHVFTTEQEILDDFASYVQMTEIQANAT